MNDYRTGGGGTSAEATLVILVDLLAEAASAEWVRAQDPLAAPEWMAGWQAAIGWALERLDGLAASEGEPDWLSRQRGLWEATR